MNNESCPKIAVVQAELDAGLLFRMLNDNRHSNFSNSSWHEYQFLWLKELLAGSGPVDSIHDNPQGSILLAHFLVMECFSHPFIHPKYGVGFVPPDTSLYKFVTYRLAPRFVMI